jgi:hypothetical protein
MNISTKLLKAAAGQGGGAGLDVDEVFSTNLWEGNGTARSITNGIDLSSEGGLVWFKMREAGFAHRLVDTERGVTKKLESQADAAEGTEAQGLTAFNSDGFTIGTADNYNLNTYDMVSWTFRKAPKFFDVVTWTSNGSGSQRVNHNLGAVPGHIVMKRTDAAGPWLMSPLYSDGDRGYRQSSSTFGFNSTGIIGTKSSGLSSGFTATDFRPEYIDGYGTYTNINGATFVAYLFAHNNSDGGFGPDGDQDIIKCGSFTGAAPATINLGFEPQFLLIKSATNSDNWYLFDTMRGLLADFSGLHFLQANLNSAEATTGTTTKITPTGFEINYGSGETFIYMAIRRGPLAVPDDATKVFTPVLGDGSGTPSIKTSHVVDFGISKKITGTAQDVTSARLLGENRIRLYSDVGASSNSYVDWDFQNGWYTWTGIDSTFINWNWKRAPSFCDVVIYAGTGSVRTVAHNLGVPPEMMWIKRTSGAVNWGVYYGDNTDRLVLNDDRKTGDFLAYWNDTSPTSSVFTLGDDNDVNGSGETFIAILFATAAGVSKIGTYTGNGSATGPIVDCGFSSGARFVLIKRIDQTSDWSVYDTVRGITAGDDKTLELSTTASETTGQVINPHNSGFQLATSDSFVNQLNGTYLFYAIA